MSDSESETGCEICLAMIASGTHGANLRAEKPESNGIKIKELNRVLGRFV